jgi:hypothetical protein
VKVWVRLRRDRAERRFNPWLNQPVEVSEVVRPAFCLWPASIATQASAQSVHRGWRIPSSPVRLAPPTPKGAPSGHRVVSAKSNHGASRLQLVLDTQIHRKYVPIHESEKNRHSAASFLLGIAATLYE